MRSSDFSKGNGDQAAAQKAADDLVARGPKIAALLVPGTSATDFPDQTKAKPELWTDGDRGEGNRCRACRCREEAKLDTVVKGGDKQAIADQLTATNKAGCGACHGAYRINKT